MERNIKLSNLKGVRRFLGNIVNKLHKGEIPTDQARAIGYLCSILCNVLKEGDLEERVKKLEEQVAIEGGKGYGFRKKNK